MARGLQNLRPRGVFSDYGSVRRINRDRDSHGIRAGGRSASRQEIGLVSQGSAQQRVPLTPRRVPNSWRLRSMRHAAMVVTYPLRRSPLNAQRVWCVEIPLPHRRMFQSRGYRPTTVHSTHTGRCHRSRWQHCGRLSESRDSTPTVPFPCWLSILPMAP